VDICGTSHHQAAERSEIRETAGVERDFAAIVNALATVGLTLALTVAWAWPAAAERPPLRAYTTATASRHDSVNRIVRDSRGFLWFHTTKACHASTAIASRTTRRTRACRIATSTISSKRGRHTARRDRRRGERVRSARRCVTLRAFTGEWK
jgi:hypothetical protein